MRLYAGSPREKADAQIEANLLFVLFRYFVARLHLSFIFIFMLIFCPTVWLALRVGAFLLAGQTVRTRDDAGLFVAAGDEKK